MRTGMIKWSFLLSGIISIVTFIFSSLNNLVWESFIRSLLIFFIFLVIIFAAQFIMRKMIGEVLPPDTGASGIGQNVNLVTPEETEVSPVGTGKDQQRRAEGDFAGFSPDDFPRVARNESSPLDPEEIAQALRVFSNE